MTIMAIVSRYVEAVTNFCVETVQWRRPTPSAVYMMIINGLFWIGVFYLTRQTQIYLLIGIATALVAVDGLQRLIYLRHERKQRAIESSSTNNNEEKKEVEKSDISRQFLEFAWNLATFPFVFGWSWVYHRFGKMCIILLSCASAYYLRQNETENACWTACATVGVFLTTPPWRYNEVNTQIINTVHYTCLSVYEFLRDYLALPIWRTIKVIGRIVRYYLFLEWLPPLIAKIKRTWQSFVDWLNRKRLAVTAWIQTRIIHPIVSFFCAVGRFLRYWFCGHWIPPLIAKIDEFKNDFVGACHRNIFDPILNGFIWLWEWGNYFARGHFIPPLKQWIHRTIITPTLTAFYNVRYVIYGKWIPGLLAYLRRKRQEISKYIKEQWIIPFVAWVKIQSRNFKIFMREKVLKPAWTKLKRSSRLALDAFNHSVIAPIARGLFQLFNYTLALFYVHVVIPSWLYCEVYLRRFKHYMWIQHIQPGMEWVRERMPEKSPFCDDSDTELCDFLPPQQSKTQSYAPSDSEGTSEAGFTPSYTRATNSQRASSLFPDQEDEDEREFIEGLEVTRFPTVYDSESTDEEFDLRPRRRVKVDNLRRRKRPYGDSTSNRVSRELTATTQPNGNTMHAEDEQNGGRQLGWGESLMTIAGNLWTATSAALLSPSETDAQTLQEADLQLEQRDQQFEILDVAKDR